jgi:hypothetical protein
VDAALPTTDGVTHSGAYSLDPSGRVLTVPTTFSWPLSALAAPGPDESVWLLRVEHVEGIPRLTLAARLVVQGDRGGRGCERRPARRRARRNESRVPPLRARWFRRRQRHGRRDAA